MNSNHNPNQRGQSLVFFAILSVAGLIFLALIIDGGGAYAMRRLAQNAADAGALAGARDYCMTHNTSTAIATAKAYAEQNNLARLGNVVSQTATATMPSDSAYINVITTIVYDTFFARILGMDQMTAVAEAEAGCFNPGAGEGVIPIAWKCRPPDEDTPEDVDCALQFTDTDSCELDAGYKYYVFVNSDDVPYVCLEWSDADKPEDGVMEEVVCDIDGDGVEEIEIVNTLQPNKAWMWVDLTGDAASANRLKEVVEGDPNVRIEVPFWVPQAEGNKTDVYQTVNSFHLFSTIGVPVYDKKCQGEHPDTDCDPMLWELGDDKPDDYSSNSLTHWFRIVTFALLHIQCVDAGGVGKDECVGRESLHYPDDPESEPLKNINTFEGCFQYGFFPGIVGTPSDGGVNAGAWTIYLTK